MRINQTKRIYMNEADGSPGGGAVVADPPAPTAAPTAPETPTLTAESVATIVASAIDTKLKAFENGLFANARKAGLLGKEKPAPDSPPTTTPSAAAPAPTGLSMADVEMMLQRDRVITRAATEHRLSDAQVKRMNSALKAEAPEDVSTWTSTYLADMGLVRTAPVTPPATATQTPATPAAAKPNISDRGGAAPTDTRDHNGVLNSRPLEMTGHDVDNLTLEHGHDKGMQMFQEKVLQALSRIRIKPPRG